MILNTSERVTCLLGGTAPGFWAGRYGQHNTRYGGSGGGGSSDAAANFRWPGRP